MRRLDEARSRIITSLATATHHDLRQLLAASEFGHAFRVAFTRDEAVEAFAQFFVRGDNAWAESDAGSGVLSVCFWRD